MISLKTAQGKKPLQSSRRVLLLEVTTEFRSLTTEGNCSGVLSSLQPIPAILDVITLIEI